LAGCAQSFPPGSAAAASQEELRSSRNLAY
jgi:hypothetical protein